jgi:hypothetical protein
LDGGRCSVARPVSADASSAVGVERLIGTWLFLRCEPPLEMEPGTRMRFASHEALEYLIPTATGPLSVTLRWRVTDGALYTEHTDGSNAVTAGIAIDDTGVLSCDFGGPRAWFVREE